MKPIKLSTLSLFLFMGSPLYANMWDMMAKPIEMTKMTDMTPKMEKVADVIPMKKLPIMDKIIDNPASDSPLGGAMSDMAKSVSIDHKKLNELAAKDVAKLDKNQDIVTDQYYADLMKVMKKIKLPEGLDLDVKVYWSPYLYVFSFANGAIRVNQGIIKKLDDDELLFIMAHEIGHLIHDDYKKSYQKAHSMFAFEKILNMGGDSMGSISNGVLSSVTSTMRQSQFQKNEEFDADAFAMQTLRENNVSKEVAISALELLQYLNAPLLKMHPTGYERIKNLKDNYSDLEDANRTKESQK